jgi:calcineurin-like phosphoesterase family protein
MSQGIFFTSDQHYGHANVIRFCKRPFSDVEEMTEELIKRHNEVVKPGDLVYHLGDMFWRSLTPEQAVSIRLRLTGQHYYINGNHEERMDQEAMKKLFIWRKDLAQIHPSGYPHVVLCHYAMRVWNGSHRGDYSLYGHSHGELPENDSLSFDVGVDSWNYYPVSLEQVAEKMRAKEESIKRLEYKCPGCERSFVAVKETEKICAGCGMKMELK